MLQISSSHTDSQKMYLDHNDLNNYRAVSNPCFIAKIRENLVLSQASSYLNSHNLYNTCQSAYRPGHSTETALLKVANDQFLSLNNGNISVLALLDFSSAFDTIDYYILVHHLQIHNGFHPISLIVHTTSFHLIIVLLLFLYTQMFISVHFLALCSSPCILSLCLQLFTHTLSSTIYLLMTYNYRCLLPLTNTTATSLYAVMYR